MSLGPRDCAYGSLSGSQVAVRHEYEVGRSSLLLLTVGAFLLLILTVSTPILPKEQLD